MLRSRIMRSVPRFHTKPEVVLRKAVHRAGLRFRLQRTDLPGTPDFVLPRYRIAVFVNGCFWHRHLGCKKSTLPKARRDWWEAKFRANIARDKRNYEALAASGWTVFVAWQCEIEKELNETVKRLVEQCHVASKQLDNA